MDSDGGRGPTEAKVLSFGKEEPLHTNQVSGCLAIGTGGELTNYARYLIPPTFLGADRDPDSSNVPLMPITRPQDLGGLDVLVAPPLK